jgi:acyl-coenzyme A synthetase/AMP-(fatty) acid ligase
VNPDRALRGRLAADPELGAGNVLTTLAGGLGRPDRPTLAFDTEVDGVPAGTPLTLAELDRAVRARAAWLHRRGIGWRDPVAVYGSTAADHVLAFLALTRLGAIPALVNGNLDGATAATYVGRLGAVAVLAGGEHALRLGAGELMGTADPATGDPVPPPYRHHPDDPVAITHSSGTTGLPKAVAHSHASLFAAIRYRLSLPLPQGSGRLLGALPAPHVATLIAVNLALANAAELLVLSRQDGATVLDAIEAWRPTGVLGFAVTWAGLARVDLAGRDLSGVRFWWNTGDCAHEAHIRRLVAQGQHDTVGRDGVTRRSGSLFVDGLGSSEMGHSMFHLTHGPDTDRYGRCIGRPHTFAEVAVLDPAGEPLPDGAVGQLGVRSPTLALGYWNDSVTTHRTRRNGWFLTGDLVRRDAEGFYYHVDRAVDAVELGGGERLYTALAEEQVLAACPDVADCTVVAVAGPAGPTADVLLQLAAGADPDRDRAAEVRAALDPPVAAVVRSVRVVAPGDIPTGATGKVRKLVLRERAAAR